MSEGSKVVTFKDFFVTFVSVLGLNLGIKYHLNNLVKLELS